MGAKGRIGLVAGLVVAAVVGTAGSASAKRISGWLQNQNLTDPDGTTYWTANGYIIWGQSYGYDSNGAYQCGVRSESNNYFLTSTTCGASAAVYQASVRSSFGTYCTSALTNWSGPWVACTTSRLCVYKNDTGDCIPTDLTAFSRGYTP